MNNITAKAAQIIQNVIRKKVMARIFKRQVRNEMGVELGGGATQRRYIRDIAARSESTMYL